MLLYCLKYKKKYFDMILSKTMILSKCAICDSKKSKFIKNQEAEGLLSSLGIRKPLRKIPLLRDVMF